MSQQLHLLLVSDTASAFGDFVDTLKNTSNINVTHTAQAKEAFATLAEQPVDVVIVDESLTGSDGLTVVREIVYRHPLINCALVSSLTPPEFHEATEGLGLFMQLPPAPGAAEAAQMLAVLDKIFGLLKPSDNGRRPS